MPTDCLLFWPVSSLPASFTLLQSHRLAFSAAPGSLALPAPGHLLVPFFSALTAFSRCFHRWPCSLFRAQVLRHLSGKDFPSHSLQTHPAPTLLLSCFPLSTYHYLKHPPSCWMIRVWAVTVSVSLTARVPALRMGLTHNSTQRCVLAEQRETHVYKVPSKVQRMEKWTWTGAIQDVSSRGDIWVRFSKREREPRD